MITDAFKQEILSEIRNGVDVMKSRETLLRYKELGIDKDSMYSVLDSLRDEMRKNGEDELEDAIIEIMDFIIGWCAPNMKIF